MSETSYQEKPKGEGKNQNYESNNTHKDYGGHSGHRSGKRYYEHGKQKSQTNDGYYYENRTRDTRKNYNYDDDEPQAGDSEHYHKKNYNNGGNSKYEGNYNKQYNSYPKGPRRTHNYQQTNVWKKKKENFTKTSREAILERFTDVGEPNQAFAEIMESNPQLFTKTPQRPIAEEKFELIPDEGVNARLPPTGQREIKEPTEEKFEKNEKGHHHEAFHTSHKAAEWDDGGDGNYEFDMNKMDALLRGGSKPKEGKETRKARLDEEEKDVDQVEPKDNEKDPWDEDNGGFSNIDEIFERKLKEKQLQFHDDEEEVDFGLLNKAPIIEEDEGEAPVWEAFDAEAIKKETKDVENMLLGWKSDNEDIREMNGLIGGSTKMTSFENDSFDKKTQPIQRSGFYAPLDDDKNSFSAFNMKQFEDSGDQDDIFRGMQPSAIRVSTDKSQLAKQSQFMQHPGMQQPISLQQHIPLQQQHPQQIPMQQHMFGPQMYYAPEQNINYMQGKTQTPMAQLPIGLQPPLQALLPNVFSHFTTFGFKPDAWYYLDRQKMKQGPFTTKQMNEWYMGNHLPMDLPITSGENINFMPLKDLIDLIFKPVISNTVRSPTMTQPTYQQQVHSPVQMMPQQQHQHQHQQQQQQQQDKSQFQFSQLLENPLFQGLATEKSTAPMPMNVKTAEELEQQALQEAYGQYGGYHHQKQNRKQSGGNVHEHSKKPHQQAHMMNPGMYSPIGMLQPGLALPQELGNPAHLAHANQAKRKNSGKMKQDKPTKEKGVKISQQASDQGQPQTTVDMTASLKNMLGIGMSTSDNGVESFANASKKKAPVPTFDTTDFPSLSDSNK